MDFKTWVRELLNGIDCTKDTGSYIESVLTNLSLPDFSQQSLTLVYWDAKQTGRFATYQQLADWILFQQSCLGSGTELYTAIAQDSYYRCYVMLDRKWMLFEELADRFPAISRSINSKIEALRIR